MVACTVKHTVTLTRPRWILFYQIPAQRSYWWFTCYTPIIHYL